ncbi:hypothetical protein VNO77_20995 [Canavalia gladiata]|uniref:Secreted protein n=1 Tax=Canavalia gladiata TaxID=3824 RepID=A0AAN9QR39_CANGL
MHRATVVVLIVLQTVLASHPRLASKLLSIHSQPWLPPTTPSKFVLFPYGRKNTVDGRWPEGLPTVIVTAGDGEEREWMFPMAE